ncbi:putative protein S-acyltransferase 3 [Auxenochlorella protothecoides]|uniref:Uncharacterized protein n=1 Tax=Auxenochlorella protothecoides TaxID=3075 RepID=A0A087SPC3_AUXPR|nr:putative protein S-acyltransferase 3 [Auxenochlorella protothecoides]KFM27577.1 putative protein S-acyltransferase 3 [Auxenochlorella protothecoides]
MSNLRPEGAEIVSAHRTRATRKAKSPGPDWKSLVASLILIYGAAGVFLGLVVPPLSRRYSWALMAVSALLVAVTAVFMVRTAARDPGFVGGLTTFHTYLVVTNQTTYEHFRHRETNSSNPYNVGAWRNIKEVFWTPVPPRFGPLPSDPSDFEDEATVAERRDLALTVRGGRHVNGSEDGAEGSGGHQSHPSPPLPDGDGGHVWTLGSPRGSMAAPGQGGEATPARQRREATFSAAWSGSPGGTSVTSKRVTNAKSQEFIRTSLRGGKKPLGFWQNVRKQLKTHPLIIGFIFFIMIFSGVFSFFMYLPSEKSVYRGK